MFLPYKIYKQYRIKRGISKKIPSIWGSSQYDSIYLRTRRGGSVVIEFNMFFSSRGADGFYRVFWPKLVGDNFFRHLRGFDDDVITSTLMDAEAAMNHALKLV